MAGLGLICFRPPADELIDKSLVAAGLQQLDDLSSLTLRDRGL
jgi:hypothetical protein